jgi:hypothetical protein
MNHTNIHNLCLRVGLGGLLAIASLATEAQEEGLAYYESTVKPLLEEHCFKCHGGGERIKAGLNLTYRSGLVKGGEHGPVLDMDAPEKSLLLDMMSFRDEEHAMPPDGKLDDATLAVFAEWVRRGAPMPDEGPAVPPAAVHESPYNNKISDETRNWWAYRPVVQPMVPVVSDAAWNESPIDAFVRARLDAAGLTPAPEADRRTLIRRVTYDLTGLPPSPVEVDAFVVDPDPAAYEKLVDRLLASPHYGEKWGRHWLDVVRYAETNGYERDNPKPHIWRYRDYVINAFNSDKPYDRFVKEQLAGDELPDGGVEGIVATGYYRLGIWDDEPVDKAQGRYDVLDGVVATTSETFLGMTMACCRCHDHKIDPLPQKDYYRMLSFFDNVTNMHTTDITRSILEGDEAAAFAQAEDEQQAKIARQDRRAADPSALPEMHASDMSGLRYRYYRDTWDALPKFDELKHEDEGAIASNFFDLGIRSRNDAFGIVFEADLHVPADAEYIFHLDCNDGARVIIDGTMVVEHDGVNNLGREQEARVQLTAGVHAIRLEYFQRVEQMGLFVSWSGPGFERRALSNDRPKVDLPALIMQHGDKVVKEGFRKRYGDLVAKAAELRKREIPGGKYAACITEYGTAAPATFVHFRGNPNSPTDEVKPGFPEILGLPDPPPATPSEELRTTMRRTQLAEWIASPENPLTGRVMMNRVWQHHFGKGISRSPSDFGQAGSLPSHPELLDWLAAEFTSGGWTLKRMHRMMLLSRTYRQSNAFNEAAYNKDPTNELLWRFDMRRLTAEEVRDSILAVNGTINLELGGESVYPPMPREVLETSSIPDKAWQSSPPEQYTRRSVYVHLKRSLRVPLLTDFDQADTDTTCPVRFVTTQPLQALNLMNSQFVEEQAQAFARRLERERADDAGRVQLALHLATGRTPDDGEINAGLAFMEEMQSLHKLDEQKALDRFALMVLNLNEFVYLD